MASDRQPKSPYQKYQKAPYFYSPIYQLWREAALKDGASSEKALVLSCKHAKYVGVRHNAADGTLAGDCDGGKTN